MSDDSLVFSARGGEDRHNYGTFSQPFLNPRKDVAFPVGGISKNRNQNLISGMYNLLSQ